MWHPPLVLLHQGVEWRSTSAQSLYSLSTRGYRWLVHFLICLSLDVPVPQSNPKAFISSITDRMISQYFPIFPAPVKITMKTWIVVNSVTSPCLLFCALRVPTRTYIFPCQMMYPNQIIWVVHDSKSLFPTGPSLSLHVYAIMAKYLSMLSKWCCLGLTTTHELLTEIMVRRREYSKVCHKPCSVNCSVSSESIV